MDTFYICVTIMITVGLVAQRVWPTPRRAIKQRPRADEILFRQEQDIKELTVLENDPEEPGLSDSMDR